MDQLGLEDEFNRFVKETPYVHLGEDICATTNVFFFAEGLQKLDIPRFAGEYLVDNGVLGTTYELVLTGVTDCARLREYRNESQAPTHGEAVVVAKLYYPCWVFLMQSEVE
jgi:hypothetical protein